MLQTRHMAFSIPLSKLELRIWIENAYAYWTEGNYAIHGMFCPKEVTYTTKQPRHNRWNESFAELGTSPFRPFRRIVHFGEKGAVLFGETRKSNLLSAKCKNNAVLRLVL